MVNSSAAVVEGYVNGEEGSEIIVHCLLELEQRESIISMCISRGLWSPDPTQHVLSCKGVI